jgi:hypothetical protein
MNFVFDLINFAVGASSGGATVVLVPKLYTAIKNKITAKATAIETAVSTDVAAAKADVSADVAKVAASVKADVAVAKAALANVASKL